MVARIDFDLLAEGLCEIYERLTTDARLKYQHTVYETSTDSTKIDNLLREEPRARNPEELGKLLVVLILQLQDSHEQVRTKLETGLYGAPLFDVAQKLGL